VKQIIALGGGFSMEPENPLLDLYILRQIEKETRTKNMSKN
jgi:dipeptidase E